MAIGHQRNEGPNINFMHVQNGSVATQRLRSVTAHALASLENDDFEEVVSKALRDRPWPVAERTMRKVTK